MQGIQGMHAQMLARLLPPEAYDPNQPNLEISLRAEGALLDKAYEDAYKLLRVIDPLRNREWLEDYERVYDLPNDIWPDDGTLENRILALAFAMREELGISKSFFIWLGSLLGYEIEIEEYSPFVAGSKAGQPLTNGDWVFVWIVKSKTSGVIKFRAGRGQAGQPLARWGNERLERIFNNLQAAYGKVYFSYGDSSNV